MPTSVKNLSWACPCFPANSTTSMASLYLRARHAHQQNRYLALAQHAIYDAALHQPPKPAAAMRSHHHQSRLIGLHTLFNTLSRSAQAALYLHFQPCAGKLLLLLIQVLQRLLNGPCLHPGKNREIASIIKSNIGLSGRAAQQQWIAKSTRHLLSNRQRALCQR